MARKKTFVSKRKKRGERKPKTHFEGVIALTGRGVGFFTREDTEEVVRIDPHATGTALNGDRVRIALLPRRKDGELRGEVTEVTLRNKLEYVGILKKEGALLFLEAQDPRMHRDIIILPQNRRRARVGQKALAKIHAATWTDPRHDPEGEVVRVIGTAGDNDTEMSAIVLDKGFTPDFPREIEASAQKIKRSAPALFEEECRRRKDLRDAPTITIDPDTAKDFDDALSVRTVAGGKLEVGIHIADVTFYVKRGSIIDKEAERRGTSIYLVDRTIPMLPEVLSNDLCSLNPDEDKLAFSAVFTFAKGASRIVSQWFGRTVVRSNKRFTYEEAQRILDQGAGPYAGELSTLNKIAKDLSKKRQTEGAISFETEEVKFRLDQDGTPIEAYTKPLLDTNKLIEEWMLLANRRVAAYASKEMKKVDASLFVFRVHDRPDEERMRELMTFLSGLGYEFGGKKPDAVSARDINALLEQATGKAEEHIVQTAAIRAMAKAVYTTKNIGHFGLGFEHYTHFTSPIRRYPDMMVHRLLDRYLSKKPVSKKLLKEHNQLTLYTSQMEQIAAEAERASVRYKQAEYMSARIGTEYDAVISGVTDWGIFAQEPNTKSEGLIRLADIGDDYYVYEKENYRLVGEHTGKIYQLGDTVRVRVASVDMDRRQINYKLVF